MLIQNCQTCIQKWWLNPRYLDFIPLISIVYGLLTWPNTHLQCIRNIFSTTIRIEEEDMFGKDKLRFLNIKVNTWCGSSISILANMLNHFFSTCLLNNISFSRKCELTSPTNSVRSYYHECFVVVLWKLLILCKTSYDALPTPWKIQMWVQVEDNWRVMSRGTFFNSQHLEG